MEALIVAALGRAKPLAIAVRAVAIVVGSWVVLILTMRLDTPWAIEPEVLSFRSDRLRRPSRARSSSSAVQQSPTGRRIHHAPLPVPNRGISGSGAHQISFHADHLVLPRRPRTVVFDAGENDTIGVFLSARESPRTSAALQGFCENVHPAPRGAHLLPLDQAQQLSPQWRPAVDQTNPLVGTTADPTSGSTSSTGARPCLTLRGDQDATSSSGMASTRTRLGTTF